MIKCCDSLLKLDYTKNQLIHLAPCPPPWKVHLLHERGALHNVSQTILDDISVRCRRQLLRHAPTLKDESICVGGCKTGTTASVTVFVLVIVLGFLIWRIKTRRRSRRLPRVKKVNPVLDLKNKIELSIITMDVSINQDPAVNHHHGSNYQPRSSCQSSPWMKTP